MRTAREGGRANGPLIRKLLLCGIAIAALAACSSSPPEASNEPPKKTPTQSETPTETPSPSPTVTPIDTSKPLEAQLEAKLEDYYMAIDRGVETLDSSPITKFVSGACRSCKIVVSDIDKAKKNGESFKVSGDFQVLDVKLYQAGQVPSVTYLLKMPRVDRVNAEGKVIGTLVTAQEIKNQAQFKQGGNGAWVVLDIITLRK